MKFSSLLLSILFIPASVSAENITLEKLLLHYQKNHPAFTSTQHANSLAQSAKKSVLGIQDWHVYANSYYSRRRSDDGVNTAEEGEYYSNDHFLGVSKLIWTLGASFNLSQSTTRRDGDVAYENNYYSNLGFRISIPLWNNVGGLYYKSWLKDAQWNIDSTELMVDERKERLLELLGLRYMGWVLAQETHSITQQHVKHLQDLQDYKKSPLPLRDQLRVDKEILRTQRELKQQTTELRSVRNSLMQYAQMQQDSERRADFDLYNLPKTNQVDFNDIISKSRVMQSLNIATKRADTYRKAALNRTKPNVRFAVSHRYYGYDDELEQSYGNDAQRQTASLSFTTPIENRTAKARLDSADTQRLINRDQIRTVELDMQSSLTETVERLNGLSESLDTSKSEVVKSNELLQQELSMFKQDKLDIAFVLDSIRALIDSKRDYASTAADYQEAYLQYRSLTDQIWTP